MSRTAKNRDLPHPKPVQKIELSEKNVKLRILFIVLFLALALAAFTRGIQGLLTTESGYVTITPQSSAELNCSSEFVFQYNLGAGHASATAEKKAITALYTDAAVTAFQVFHKEQAFDGVYNVYYINQHPGEVIEVDELLYQAFLQLEESGRRDLYLAPIYAEYENLFGCQEDSLAYNFDPYRNEELREEFAKTAEFINDPDAVQVVLLGDNKIKLQVSEEYAAYWEETGYASYIDFSWMKNAFIIDYLADVMMENGYTRGSISSYDGFVRNLDDSGNAYSFNLYDRVGQTVYPAATMEYSGAAAIVYLRSYKMNSLDAQHYYELENGEVRTPYVDTADGLCKNALNNLVSYSYKEGCAAVLLRMMPLYIADAFDKTAVAALSSEGIYSVYFENYTAYYNDSALTLYDFYDKDGVSYQSWLP
jgi:hypothetical protein